MIHLRRCARPLGLLSLCGLLLVTVGCNQMLAKFSLGRATKNRDAAVKIEAARFSAQRLNETNSLINKATNELNSQDYRNAKESAKQALASSKQLLTETKTLCANSLKQDAYKWLAISALNQGQQENAQLDQQIRQANEKGGQQIDKQNYDNAIEIFGKVVSDVQFLLSNLARDSKAGLAEAEQMKKDLITEGAPDNAPEYVERMTSKIEEIRSFIEKDNNYRAALIGRDQARQIKQEGIQKTKEEKSRKQLQEIENLLDEATVLGAAIYAQQNYNTISKDFETLLTQFYDKNYDTVLSTAPKLKPRVESLIVETKRAAAEAKIKEVEAAINTLTDGRARQYLPGRVEQLDALLLDARKLYDGQKYVESKEISMRALELNQTILGEFNTLAQQQIQAASERLGIAEGVYKTMQNIFDQVIPGNWQDDDLALEQGKKALKQELSAQLTNARLALGVAELKRNEKDFRTGIETAKQVAESSDNVTQQTYRVVAHNAILELANSLSFYEGQGGRQYAAEEMNKTAAMLEESKNLLHSGQYRDAVRRAADTKAQQEILVQELQRVAVRQIDQAQSSVNHAKGNRAEQYQSAGFNQALVSLDQAREALDNKSLKVAIEAAEKAKTIASDVSQQSLKQWSGDLLQQTDDLLGRARKAGSDRFAGDQLQSAISRRASTQHLYDAADYQAAIDAGQQAVSAANSALYGRVIKAESDVATARRYQGWEYEPQLLARAMVAAKNAREAMDAGKYGEGEEAANLAVACAEKATVQAKRKSFDARLASLNEKMTEAQSKGAGYYQIRDLSKLMTEIHQLQDEFSPEGYQDLSKKLEKLEAQLGGLMEMTPAVLDDALGSEKNQLQTLDDRGAREFHAVKLEEIDRKIKYARLDYKNQKFRSSYQNAKDAQVLLDEIKLRMDERDFDAALHKEFAAFNDELKKFGPVLNMGSMALNRLVIDTGGKSQALTLMQASSPSDLRTQITQIRAEVNQMKPPYTRREIHNAALNMLQTAQTAASNFEKLIILDQYTPKDAREIVNSAFVQMYRARDEQGKIEKKLIAPNTEFQPAGVEHVVSYKGN